MCLSAFVVNITRVSHHIIHPILGQGWNVPHLTSEHRDLSNPQVTCWVCRTMTQSSARSGLGWTAISDSCRPSSPPSMPPNPGAAAPRPPSRTSLTMGTVSELAAKRTQVSKLSRPTPLFLVQLNVSWTLHASLSWVLRNYRGKAMMPFASVAWPLGLNTLCARGWMYAPGYGALWSAKDRWCVWPRSYRQWKERPAGRDASAFRESVWTRPARGTIR